MSVFQQTMVQSLVYALNGTPSARWNFPLALGTSRDSPGGIGEGVTINYGFPSSVPSDLTATSPFRTGFAPLPDAAKVAVRSVLAQVADITNLRFVEVPGDQASLRYADYLSATAAGQGAYPVYSTRYDQTGTITSISLIPSVGYVGLDLTDQGSTGLVQGRFFYGTILHETGHALGLKHPFETPNVMPIEADAERWTIMSYNRVLDLTPTVTPAQVAAGTPLALGYVRDSTYMIADIAALQYLYGANMLTRSGDDTYRWDTSAAFRQTIWDGGGNDTIDCSNQALTCRINLTPGTLSTIALRVTPAELKIGWPSNYTATTQAYTGQDNLGIAFGAIIENAIGGSNNDTLTGNDANNVLTGGPGNDTLDGGAGIDTARFTGSKASYAIRTAGSGWSVSDNTAVRDGADTLANVERLRFSDLSVALDLNGNAGITAKILGAVFGASAVSNTQYAGIGLHYLDAGTSYQALVQLALNAKLGSGFTNDAEIRLLYQNLLGTAPSAADLAFWGNAIASGQYSQASLAVMAADTSFNASNIHLTGLAATGLEYQAIL